MEQKIKEREDEIFFIATDWGYGAGILTSSFIVTLTYLSFPTSFVVLSYALTLVGAFWMFKSIYDRKKLK